MNITDYRNIPTIELPAGTCRPLTAAECEQRAAETLAELATPLSARDRRFLKRELRAWQRLAAERA